MSAMDEIVNLEDRAHVCIKEEYDADFTIIDENYDIYIKEELKDEEWEGNCDNISTEEQNNVGEYDANIAIIDIKEELKGEEGEGNCDDVSIEEQNYDADITIIDDSYDIYIKDELKDEGEGNCDDVSIEEQNNVGEYDANITIIDENYDIDIKEELKDEEGKGNCDDVSIEEQNNVDVFVMEEEQTAQYIPFEDDVIKHDDFLDDPLSVDENEEHATTINNEVVEKGVTPENDRRKRLVEMYLSGKCQVTDAYINGNIRYYQCFLCQKVYAAEMGLRYHIITEHTNEAEQEKRELEEKQRRQQKEREEKELQWKKEQQRQQKWLEEEKLRRKRYRKLRKRVEKEKSEEEKEKHQSGSCRCNSFSSSASCYYCSRPFFCEELLKSHVTREHTNPEYEKVYRCKCCCGIFKVSRLHVQKSDADVVCGLCRMQFKKLSRLSMHISVNHNGRYTCKHCDQEFVLKREFEDHLLDQHSLAL